MTALMPASWSTTDDPRLLRELVGRARHLASEHAVPSVVVGFTADEGNLLFPDFVAFVESQLRVEDSIFRMTRERVLLFIADVRRDRAASIVERLVEQFSAEFTTTRMPDIAIRYFEVQPGTQELAVRDVLPAVFASEVEDTF
jgi:hypothetical protein